jgi:hypothetical protein
MVDKIKYLYFSVSIYFIKSNKDSKKMEKLNVKKNGYAIMGIK